MKKLYIIPRTHYQTELDIKEQDEKIYNSLYGKGNWKLSASGRAMPIRTSKADQESSELCKKARLDIRA